MFFWDNQPWLELNLTVFLLQRKSVRPPLNHVIIESDPVIDPYPVPVLHHGLT